MTYLDAFRLSLWSVIILEASNFLQPLFNIVFKAFTTLETFMQEYTVLTPMILGIVVFLFFNFD